MPLQSCVLRLLTTQCFWPWFWLNLKSSQSTRRMSEDNKTPWNALCNDSWLLIWGLVQFKWGHDLTEKLQIRPNWTHSTRKWDDFQNGSLQWSLSTYEVPFHWLRAILFTNFQCYKDEYFGIQNFNIFYAWGHNSVCCCHMTDSHHIFHYLPTLDTVSVFQNNYMRWISELI